MRKRLVVASLFLVFCNPVYADVTGNVEVVRTCVRVSDLLGFSADAIFRSSSKADADAGIERLLARYGEDVDVLEIVGGEMTSALFDEKTGKVRSALASIRSCHSASGNACGASEKDLLVTAATLTVSCKIDFNGGKL